MENLSILTLHIAYKYMDVNLSTNPSVASLGMDSTSDLSASIPPTGFTVFPSTTSKVLNVPVHSPNKVPLLNTQRSLCDDQLKK